MKILLSWLDDYIKTGLSAAKISDILSDLGFPCAGIEYLGDDAVIDVEVTSNRGDCLSYMGIARELAAVTGKKLKTPAVKLNESKTSVKGIVSVKIVESKLCGRYAARLIRGVKVGQSPDWLKKRLAACGMRSVNNVVDATNYAMLETGQPPHAFDFDKINGGQIIVRKAASGEKMTSIDGTECRLDDQMLVIADTAGPIAIAGVMGGLDTEVSDRTATVLLEDAYFAPLAVRTTSRRLSLPSESSFRFERTVDIEAIDWASKRTAQLITEVAGGEVLKGAVDVYPSKSVRPKQAVMRSSRLNTLLGIKVPQAAAVRILSRLSFKPKQKGDKISCTVPSWRSDIYREADLIEEVSRVYGYGKLPTGSKISIKAVSVDMRHALVDAVGTYLNGSGFYETISTSFIDESVAELFSGADTKKSLSVKDVTRKTTNLLRQNLIGSLLAVLKGNLNVGNSPCRIFEISNTFVPAEKKDVLPIERTKVAIASDGGIREVWGVVEGLVKNISRDADVVFRPAELVWSQAGAEIVANGKVVGTAGIVSQKTRDRFDFKDVSPCCAELDFEVLALLRSGTVKVKPIPRFPAIVRDLSLIVDETVSWSQIVNAVNEKGPSELEKVDFVDVYHGKSISEDKKSVTLSLRFRDEEGTLTHETVDSFQSDIIKSLAASVGAQLRTA